MITFLLFLGSIGQAHAEESEGFGVSSYLDEIFNLGQNYTNSQLEECKIDGVGTQEQCQELADAGFEALQSSKDLAFSFHHFAEALVQFISPVQLGGFIVAVISALMGFLFFMKIGGKFGRHAGEVMLVLFGIGMIFLILGDTLKI